jgi:hypothetical protein
VRYRTDGEREAVQTPIKSRGALHGTPIVLCRIDLPPRSGGRENASAARNRNYISQQPGSRTTKKVHSMLYTIAVILLILWALGLVTSYTLGGFVHILLVVAVIMIVVNLLSGRRAT